MLVSVNDSCLKNTLRTGSMGLIVGSYMAFVDGTFVLNPITDYAHLAGRGLMKHALPAAFGFSVFGATTCMLDNMRGKGKPLSNGMIGGFIGGFCAGTRFHEPKWSLILGSTGALLGFFSRLFGSHFMIDDRKILLDQINKTLDMKKLEHLAPTSHLALKKPDADAAV